MSRFSVIEIPDYTPEEKKIIFSRFALPKVLKRMGMEAHECVVSEDALEAIIARYEGTSGIRDLEQAAEHIAANALYQIEANHVDSVCFDGETVRTLLELQNLDNKRKTGLVEKCDNGHFQSIQFLL